MRQKGTQQPGGGNKPAEWGEKVEDAGQWGALGNSRGLVLSVFYSHNKSSTRSLQRTQTRIKFFKKTRISIITLPRKTYFFFYTSH